MIHDFVGLNSIIYANYSNYSVIVSTLFFTLSVNFVAKFISAVEVCLWYLIVGILGFETLPLLRRMHQPCLEVLVLLPGLHQPWIEFLFCLLPYAHHLSHVCKVFLEPVVLRAFFRLQPAAFNAAYSSHSNTVLSEDCMVIMDSGVPRICLLGIWHA